MVSFSCEACGDVLTKKKLDPHRNQCRGASFTCIDCMVHFEGTSYRAHTSCMSEAQKYQGALYKEKPTKNQRKGKNDSKQNSKPNTNGQSLANNAPDADTSQANAPPPPAPTPPLPEAGAQPPATTVANTGKPINVFDYLVTEQTPNASRVSLGGSKEQMTMVADAPSVFEPSKVLARLDSGKEDEDKAYDIAYEENGYSYGADPIDGPVYGNKTSNVSMEFMTPAPKKKKDRKGGKKENSSENGVANGAATTSDKKRKRHVEDVDMDAAPEEDTPMMDAPSSVANNAGTPHLNHSGLTGGLNRMLRSPSLEGDDNYDHTSSPIKRSRRKGKETNGDGLGISIRDRAERVVSSMFGGPSLSGSNVSSTEPSSKAMVPSQLEIRKSRKAHKDRHASNGHSVVSDSRTTKRKSSAQVDADRPSRRLKQIEYRQDSADDNRQVVVYRHSRASDEQLQREMASHFLSLVNKGPESGRGLSVNKVLKRFHRDFPAMSGSEDRYGERGRGHGHGRAKADDEKELWRALRLKRNDRGEIVLFI